MRSLRFAPMIFAATLITMACMYAAACTPRRANPEADKDGGGPQITDFDVGDGASTETVEPDDTAKVPFLFSLGCSGKYEGVNCEEQCAKDPSFGYCKTYETEACTGCVATSDDLCAKSSECADDGSCALYGNPPFCAPSDPGDCAKSAVCIKHGMCDLQTFCAIHPLTGERHLRPTCASSASSCKNGETLVKYLDKDGCPMWINCDKPRIADGDCDSACAIVGACKAKGGNCVAE